MNIYDFDNTIYAKDSTIEFYKYCLRKYPKVKYCIPQQMFGLLLYIVNLYSKRQFKEKFFSFIKYVPNIEKTVDEFWNMEESNIYSWYIEKKSDTDVIISASPEFLILPISKRLGVSNVTATKVDEVSGKFLSENCHGQEKLKRLMENKLLANQVVEEFYSDSYSDKPLADIANFSYMVIKGNIEKWPDKPPKSNNLLELIRYGFWGGVTTILNLLLFALAICLGIPYLISNVSTYVIAVVASYILNKKFVFNEGTQVDDRTALEVIKFFEVRLLSIIVDCSLLWIFVDILELNILLSKVVISAFIIIVTYLLNKFFVFKKLQENKIHE